LPSPEKKSRRTIDFLLTVYSKYSPVFFIFATNSVEPWFDSVAD